MNRHLLILDLDETLLHSAKSQLDRPADFQLASYWVYTRPHLVEFLDAVFQWFDVAVWTSAGSGYAASIVPQVFPSPDLLKFIWTADRCTRRYDSELDVQYWIKDFKKLKRAGYNLDHVLVIDDSPEKHSRNYGNLIRVSAFTGDSRDTELRELRHYLNHIRVVENCRTIEKRIWRMVSHQVSRQVLNDQESTP